MHPDGRLKGCRLKFEPAGRTHENSEYYTSQKDESVRYIERRRYRSHEAPYRPQAF